MAASATGVTTMAVTCYDLLGPDGELAEFETFALRRPRRDAAERSSAGTTVTTLGEPICIVEPVNRRPW